MTWRPLDRQNSGTEEGPYEGVPSHLTALLWDWVRSYITYRGDFQTAIIRRVALMARISIRADGNSIDVYEDLKKACLSDEQKFLMRSMRY